MVLNYQPKLAERIVLQTPRTIIGLFITSFLFVYIYLPFIPIEYLVIWSIAQLVFIYLRHDNAKRLDKAIKVNDLNALQLNSNRLMGLIIYSALLWSAMTVMGYIFAPIDYVYMAFMIMIGIVTVASLTLTAFFHVFVAYYIIMFLSQMTILLMIGGSIHLSLFTLSILFMFLMFGLAKNVYLDNLKTIEVEEKLKENNEKLKMLSMTDPLTQIYNRRYFFNSVEQFITLALRENKKLSLLMLDIDYFKTINDKHGHQVGDQVLINLTQNINKTVRKSDVFARIGGEEFAILLVNTEKDEAYELARKIRKNIEHDAIQLDGLEIQITVSIGLASLNDQIDTSILLYQEADENLYNAKHLGRNQVNMGEKPQE